MKRNTKLTLLGITTAIIVFLISFSTYILATNDDSGKRTSIQASSIDWNILLESEVTSAINDITINGNLLVNSDDYLTFTEKLAEDPTLVSEKPFENSSEIYVKFDHAGYFQMYYDKTKYDSKETTFFVSNDLVADYEVREDY